MGFSPCHASEKCDQQNKFQIYKVCHSNVHEMTPFLQKLFHISCHYFGSMLLTPYTAMSLVSYQLEFFSLILFHPSLTSKFSFLALARILHALCISEGFITGICEWQISLSLASIRQEGYCFSKLAKHKKKKTRM